MVKPDKSRRNPDGTFAPGNVLGGKPKGCRHKATRAVEALLDGEAEALTRKAIEKALGGDTVALRLCLDRIAPPRKDAPVTIDLPAMDTTEDAAKVAAAILQAVADGEVTPSEATTIVGFVEIFRRTLETRELEARISELEKGNIR